MPERFYNYREENSDDPQAEKFRKLFIGGLNYDTTEEVIKQHFEQWGEIVDCVVMKNPSTKRSRGFGFITYKSAEMLDEAQKNRPHKIDSRELDTKRAMPRNESDETQTSVKKMFVGGLKEETSEDDIRDIFGGFGKIEKLEMIKDKATGKQRGFCFITYEDFDSVDKCVLKRRISLNGKMVEVKKAVSKDREGGMGAGGGRGGRGGGSRGGMGGGRGGFGGANGGGGGGGGGYNDGYGYQCNMGYQGNTGGPQGYGGNGPQGYGGGNQGGYGGGGYGSGGGGMGGGRYGGGGGGGGGGDFNDGYNNFGSGYGYGNGGGPTRGGGGGGGFNQRGNGPYGGGYGSGGGGGSGGGMGGSYRR